MISLKPTEFRALMAQIQCLLAEFADAWDPSGGTETTVRNATLEQAAELSKELRRYDFS